LSALVSERNSEADIKKIKRVVRLRTRGQRTNIYSTVTPSFETSHRNFSRDWPAMTTDSDAQPPFGFVARAAGPGYIAVGYRWSGMRLWSHVERFWCEHKRGHGALLKRCLTRPSCRYEPIARNSIEWRARRRQVYCLRSS
jgi:hypothetical protein